MQMYRGSAGLALKIPFSILVTIRCLPNSIPSFTGSMFDSMLLAALIAEYPSPFLYKLSKNSVPSLIDAFEICCLSFAKYGPLLEVYLVLFSCK